jgi:shikimate kinase
MGTGKTTVGRQLARQIGWHFVDLDARIEERAGLKISELFEHLGEPAFRDIEYEELARALGKAREQERGLVLALGGGTFAQPRDVELLREAACTVIWLDCPVEELLTRCARMTHRPLFRDEKSFRELYENRRPFYEKADYRVTSDRDPQKVVVDILALGILGRVSV